jgi:hypothetical protein
MGQMKCDHNKWLIALTSDQIKRLSLLYKYFKFELSILKMCT